MRDEYLHIGAYAVLSLRPQIVIETATYCPNDHGVFYKAAFCPECGVALLTRETSKETMPSFYDLFPFSDDPHLRRVDVPGTAPDQVIVIGNYTNDRTRYPDVDSGSARVKIKPEDPEVFIDVFKERYATSLTELRNNRHVKDLWINFGVLAWTA